MNTALDEFDILSGMTTENMKKSQSYSPTFGLHAITHAFSLVYWFMQNCIQMHGEVNSPSQMYVTYQTHGHCYT